MTPKVKIALHAALGLFGFSVALLAAYFGHLLIFAFLVLITTLFASSSKFAKEVKNIKLWKEAFGGRYNDYPHNEEQLLAAYEPLCERFCVLTQRYVDVKKRYDAAKIKFKGGHLGVHLESEMAQCDDDMDKIWNLLDYFGLLPSDPADDLPWGGWKAFIESTSSNQAFA